MSRDNPIHCYSGRGTHIILVRGMKSRRNWKSRVTNETVIRRRGLFPVLHWPTLKLDGSKHKRRRDEVYRKITQVPTPSFLAFSHKHSLQKHFQLGSDKLIVCYNQYYRPAFIETLLWARVYVRGYKYEEETAADCSNITLLAKNS